MDEKIVVWRLEAPDGHGPYRPASERDISPAEWLQEKHGINVFGPDWIRPTPPQDGIEYTGDSKNWFFGFASEEQLESWFPREVRLLLRFKRVRVVRYQVARTYVLHGDRQVAFRKAEAKPLHTKGGEKA